MDFQLKNKIISNNNLDDKTISTYVVFLYILRAFNIAIKGSINFDTSCNMILNIIYVCIHFVFLLFMLMKLTKKDKLFLICLLGCASFYILLNCYFSLENSLKIIEKSMWLLIADIPIIFFLTRLKDLETFYKTLVRYSIYISLPCFFLYYNHVSKLSSNMVFSYTLLVPLLVHINEAFIRKKLIFILLSIYELYLVLIYGSRGSLLVLLVYVVLYIFTTYKKKISKKQIAFFLIAIGLVSFISMLILPLVNEKLLETGLYIRNLDFIVNGTFFSSNHRVEIYHAFFNYILQRPILGWGLSGEFIVGEYPHNFIIEIIFNFGILIGCFIVFFICFLGYQSLIKKTYSKKLTIIFFSIGIIPLLLSSSYLEWLPFWTFLGISIVSKSEMTINNKKVLCVFNQLGIGGAAKSLAFVANSCHDAGYETKVVSYSSTKKVVNINENISISYLDYDAFDEVKKRKGEIIFNKIKLILKLRKCIIDYAPDLIIVFMSNITSATILADILLSNYVISSERGNPKRYSSKKMLFYSLFYNQCHRLIVQTNDSLLYLNKYIYRKIMKIPNYCEIPSYNLSEGNRKELILTAGRFSNEKGFNYLIEAFAILLNEYPQYTLKIYGDNGDDSEIVELINKLKLNEHISIIKGSTNFFKNEVDASMFVLPSLEEGMPNVLMEAMAHKIPAIATDCPIGGPKELLGEQGGILVPIKSTDGLYRAMKKYIENQSYAESCANISFKRIKNYSPDKIKKIWISAIKEVLND